MSYAEWRPAIEQLTGEIFMPSERLFELAAEVPPDQQIVEVGSYCGKSALTMAAGAAEGRGAHVYCVDTWGLPIAPMNPYNVLANLGYLLCQAENLGLLGQFTPLRGYSTDMARLRDVDPAGVPLGGWRIGLLFIDAAHYRADVESDIAVWLPQVVPGGRVLFHDYTYPYSPDVKAAVDAWYDKASGAGEWEGFRIVEPIEKTWTVEARRCAC